MGHLQSTIDLLLLAGASFLASSAIAYAWWAYVRVFFLRERLFKIRDHLWDEARRLEAFDDPAYQDARRRINSFIAIASLLSIKAIEIVQGQSAKRSRAALTLRQSDNPETNRAIKKALGEAVLVIAGYVLFYRLSGWLYIAKAKLQIWKEARRADREKVENCVARQFETSTFDVIASIDAKVERSDLVGAGLD